jgi:hypothetical protein
MARILGAKECARLNDGGGPRAGDLIINYGNSKHPEWGYSSARWLNRPDRVINAADKRITFKLLFDAGVPTVGWTLSADEAQQWSNEGHYVYERHIVRGHSGQGLELTTPFGRVDEAPLYTKGEALPFREYRFYMGGGNILNVSEKRRKRGMEVNEYVRTNANGWVFCNADVEYSDEAAKYARGSMSALGLDYGAVDLLVGVRGPVVVEVNSAPGWRNTVTKDVYTNYFNEVHNAIQRQMG